MVEQSSGRQPPYSESHTNPVRVHSWGSTTGGSIGSGGVVRAHTPQYGGSWIEVATGTGSNHMESPICSTSERCPWASIGPSVVPQDSSRGLWPQPDSEQKRRLHVGGSWICSTLLTSVQPSGAESEQSPHSTSVNRNSHIRSSVAPWSW